METTAPLPDRIRGLLSAVTLAGPDRPGVVLGVPAVLSEICAYLGFRNPCSRGRVYLTPAKMAHLGLVQR